jgi:FtsP/CotA-like multicopper oxidase with cupredoxin domain
LPHAGSSDAAQQGRGLLGPFIVKEAVKADVDVDGAIVLSDWNVDANGQIKDDFSDPIAGRTSGRKGALVFANGGAAPLRLGTRPGARVRLRLGNAATARLTTVAIEGTKTLIVAVDGSRASRSNRSTASFQWALARVSSWSSICRATSRPAFA